MRGRAERPLVVVDLAVPADVERGGGRVAGVRLFDVDDLRVGPRRRDGVTPARGPEGRGDRRGGGRELRPPVSRARGRAAPVASFAGRPSRSASSEVERALRDLGDVDPADRRARSSTCRASLVTKLLHDPTVRAARARGRGRRRRGRRRRARAVRHLRSERPVSAPPLPAAVILGTRASAARARADGARRRAPASACAAVARVHDACDRHEPATARRRAASRCPRSAARGSSRPSSSGRSAAGRSTSPCTRSRTSRPRTLPASSSARCCAREDVRDCLVARRRAHARRASRRARSSGRAASAAPRSSRRFVRTSRSARSAGTSTRASARCARASTTRRCSRRRAFDGSGSSSVVTEWLAAETMLPAPGQGALAIQCRASDDARARAPRAIDDAGARAETTAERAFLRALGGGCAAPVAALRDAERRPARVRLQRARRVGRRTEVVRV